MKTRGLYMAWLIAVVSVAMSLFFSEVMKLPPCVLCWWQRIFMYPLVLILGIGILTEDRAAIRYAFPLSALGLVTAIYHNLLYYGVVPEAISPCVEGVSCSTRQIEWFGVVTIPMMAFFGFLMISYLLWKERPIK